MGDTDNNLPTSEPTAGLDRRHRRVAIACAVFVAAMVGAAYASVPLYNLFCKVTGFGGTTQVATEGAATVLDRTIRIRFDANVAPGLDWEFEPVQREMDVKVGQTALAFYRVHNRSNAESWGSATYNVTPEQTGGYFSKIYCFCFDKQHLAANEEMEMPVQFFVDPSIAEDAELDGVDTITLSYTFFSAKPPAVAQTGEATPKL